MELLLKDGANMGVRTGTADKRSLAAEKVESNMGLHWSDFPGPLRALVRGARTRAVEQRKQQ